MTTIIFPGQGSQARGMGANLFERFPDETACADSILGYSIKRLCLEDPDNQLGLTQFTQPALYVVNGLSYFAQRQADARAPDLLMGHSLGEYNALLAAGVFDFETGLRLVKRRGELMGQAPTGAMAAIIGLPEDTIGRILREGGLEGIDVANYNSREQLVLAGPRDEILEAVPLLERSGATVFVLNVKSPFHSRYMAQALPEFEAYVSSLSFAPPLIPVLSNVSALPHVSGAIQTALVSQIREPVRWLECVHYALGLGESEFLEIGPGRVLTNLVAKIRPHYERDPITIIPAAKPEPDVITPHLQPALTIASPVAAEHPKPADLIAPATELASNLVSSVPLAVIGFFAQEFGEVKPAETGIWGFDPNLFNFDAATVDSLHPSLRLLLQHTYLTLEKAGYAPTLMEGSEVATVTTVGCTANESLGVAAAQEVSRLMGFRGPCYSLVGDANDALQPLHLAGQMLRSGEASVAVVGHVRLTAEKRAADTADQQGAVAIFILKLLQDAEADRDQIHAVVASSTATHFGPTGGVAGDAGYVRNQRAAWDPMSIAAQARADLFTAANDIHSDDGGCNARFNSFIRAVEILCLGGIKTPWPGALSLNTVLIESSARDRIRTALLLHEHRVKRPAPANDMHIVVLSAHDATNLIQLATSLRDHLRRTPTLVLADVAFTLQFGRAALGERLALIASSIEQLIEKLQTVINGNLDEQVFRGHARELNASAIALDDEAGRRYLLSVLAGGKLDKIAQLWARGAVIDWSMLAGEGRRCALPGSSLHLAFIPPRAVAHRAPTNILHPLLKQNESNFSAQQFRSLFTGTEFFFSDHKLHGLCILPGVAHLEMARAATALSAQVPVVALRDVSWVRPVSVASGSANVLIRLEPRNGDAQFEIVQLSADSEETACSQGVAVFDETLRSPRPLALAELRAGCTRQVNAAELYEWSSLGGFYYGPSMRALTKLHIAKSHVIADITLPADVDADSRAMILQPALLDAALQSVSGLEILTSTRGSLLPYAMGELQIFGEVPVHSYAYARSSATTLKASGMRLFDIDIADAAGNILVAIRDLCMRLVEGPERMATRAAPPQRQPESSAEIDAALQQMSTSELDELLASFTR